MSGDTHMTGSTQKGEDIELYVEQDAKCCYVSITSADFGYIQFNFNPDFPQDARQFYVGLLEVQDIDWEERS